MGEALSVGAETATAVSVGSGAIEVITAASNVDGLLLHTLTCFAAGNASYVRGFVQLADGTEIILAHSANRNAGWVGKLAVPAGASVRVRGSEATTGFASFDSLP